MAKPGQATIVDDVQTDADARVRMEPRAPGVSRKVLTAEQAAQFKQGAAPSEVVLQGRQAERIFDSGAPPTETVEEAEAPPDPQAGLDLPAWLKGVQFEESDGVEPEAMKSLVDYKSVKDAAKALIHSKKQIGKMASEKAGLSRQVEDLLKAPKQPDIPPSTPEETQKAIKVISENFLDDIPGNITKLVETVQKMTAAQAQGSINRLGESVEAGQVEALFLGYPGLVANAEDAAKVDELASGAKAKTTLGKYKSALSEFAKEKGYVSGDAYSKPVNLEPAPKTAPVTRTATTKKVYNRAWLQQQAVQNQDWYRANQPEIMAAYAEGRVR